MREKHLEALQSLADILKLSILREENFSNTPSIVVDDGEGNEVHVGFPDGTHSMDGKKAYPPAATDKVYQPRIKMRPYGHGAWRFYIDI